MQVKLKDLNQYKKIVIQCHDNPDADTIASGYGLYTYFKMQGIKTSLIYSGRFEINKSNLTIMVQELDIPITYVKQEKFQPLEKEDLLITADCQYGAGNVTKLPAQNVAVIDHHQQEIKDLPMMYIDPMCGSCSTIVWRMMLEEEVDINKNESLATALYYGLYTDTNQLAEIHNPYDKDMRDTLLYNKPIITKLRNSNLSLAELETAGIALIRYIYNEVYHYAVIKARPCDPNILGLISDLVLQVDCVDCCVVYNELTDGIKLSVRSCTKETRADELASYLTNKIGSGGGHVQKAGGFINRRLFDISFGTMTVETYFSQKLDQYFQSYDIIYADKYEAELTAMKLYKKCPIPLGMAKAKDMLEAGTPVLIRTLEGDIDTIISDDIYIMIGILGEVYPIKKEKFEHSYSLTKESYQIDLKYNPVIKNRKDGKIYDLIQYAKSCIPKEESFIYAKQLEQAVKVFTAWDKEKYMRGDKGDFLAVRSDDHHDIYVIDKEIFYGTYQIWEEGM